MSLYKSLADAEKKASRASQQIEAMQKEKDMMGSELVKRSDEIRNLNEKLNLMQAALDRGNHACSDSCIQIIYLPDALGTNEIKKKHFRSIR